MHKLQILSNACSFQMQRFFQTSLFQPQVLFAHTLLLLFLFHSTLFCFHAAQTVIRPTLPQSFFIERLKAGCEIWSSSAAFVKVPFFAKATNCSSKNISIVSYLLCSIRISITFIYTIIIYRHFTFNELQFRISLYICFIHK